MWAAHLSSVFHWSVLNHQKSVQMRASTIQEVKFTEPNLSRYTPFSWFLNDQLVIFVDDAAAYMWLRQPDRFPLNNSKID